MSETTPRLSPAWYVEENKRLAAEIASLRAQLDEAKARIAELEKALRDVAEAKMPGLARYIARTTLEASERGGGE